MNCNLLQRQRDSLDNHKRIISIVVFTFSLFLVGCASREDQLPHTAPAPRELYVLEDPSIGDWGSTHEHAALLIFIQGKHFDLSRPEYMVRAKRIHIEGGNGVVIHKHATGITLGHFLESLGMQLDKRCFMGDTGNGYCTNEKERLTFYVNGQPNNEFDTYVIRDNDKIVLSYGNGDKTHINEQLRLADNIQIYPSY